MLEKLIDDQGEAVVNALIKAAVDGDVTAGKALLDRLVPPRRDRPVTFKLPVLVSAADAPKALAAVTAAVAAGDLTPTEAGDLSALVERFVKVLEAADFEQRLAALEAANGGRK